MREEGDTMVPQAKKRIRTFRDLVVWQKAVALVTQVYGVTGAFPRTEVFGLVSQMRRCAVSVPSNIAEGYGRRSSRDYVRCLQLSLSSLYELQTQMEIARNLSYLAEPESGPVTEACNEIERMLCSLIAKLRQKL